MNKKFVDKVRRISREIEKAKDKLRRIAKRGGMRENFGDAEYRKIEDMIDITDYSSNGKKIREMLSNFRDWCSGVGIEV